MQEKLSFAFSRSDLFNRMFNLLYGALGEHYKIAVGRMIGKTRDIRHWEAEVTDHLDKFEDCFTFSTKSRFNKFNLFGEVVSSLRLVDRSRRGNAATKLQGERYKYVVPKSVTPDRPEFDQASQEFFDRVTRIARHACGLS